MRSGITFILFFTCFTSFGQADANFTIKGEINGLGDGVKIRIYADGQRFFVADTVNLGTAIVHNSKFQLSGNIKSNGGRYILRQDKEGGSLTTVYLDSGSIVSLKGKSDKPLELEIIDHGGRGTQRDRNKYLKIMAPLIREYNLPDADKEKINNKILVARRDFILNNKCSYYVPSIMLDASDDLLYYYHYQARGYHIDNFAIPYKEVKELFELLDEKVKKSVEGLKVRDRINEVETVAMMKAGRADVGQKLPFFKLLTPTGDTTSLYQVLGKKKSSLVLLLLWYPNLDVPPTNEIRILNDLIKEYDESELTIISIDRCACYLYNRNEQVYQIEEISEEKIQWQQLVELRNFGAEDNGLSYAQIFFKASNFRPYIALLNSEGEIISKDISVFQIQQIIKEKMNERIKINP